MNKPFAVFAAAVCSCGSNTGGDPSVVPFACSASTFASLGMSSADQPNYTLPPLAPGQHLTFTLTVTNAGQMNATQLRDITATNDDLSVTQNTCGDTLAAGATCTLTVQANGTTVGRHIQLVALNYYNGSVFTDDAHDVTFDVADAPFVSVAPAPPPVMTAHTTGMLPNVNLVTVTFSDSSDDDAVSALGAWLVTSPWYVALATDYGLSAGTHQHVRLTTQSPDLVYGNDDVLSLVKSGELPTRGDGQDLYMFFFTPRTAYPSSQLNASGWHSWAMSGSTPVAYAVIKPTCPGSTPQSFVAAHELIEAATDTNGGYNFGASESEVGDLCDAHVTTDAGYVLPTIWSNVAAQQGGDPCVPSLGAPYFNVSVTPSGPQTIAAGATQMFTLTGGSTAAVGDWRIAGVVGGLVPDGARFSVTFPNDLINNGRQLPLSVSVAPGTPSGTSIVIPLVSHSRTGGPQGRLQIISITVQ